MIFLRTEGGNPYGGEGIVEGGKDPGGHYVCPRFSKPSLSHDSSKSRVIF